MNDETTMEQRARQAEKECLYTPAVPGDEWTRDMACQFATDFARQEVRRREEEIVARLEQEAIVMLDQYDNSFFAGRLRKLAEEIKSGWKETQ